MNVPKLRFKEFNDDYKEYKLIEISNNIGGGTPSTSINEYWNGSLPWISSSDISLNNFYKINIHRYITEEAIINSATKLIPKNSILIVSRVGIGKIGINNVNICTSQDFTNLVNVKGNTFYVALCIKKIIDKNDNNSQGTSIKGITSKAILNFKINLPNIKEQEKIASMLSLIDKKIELQSKKIEALKLYKKGIILGTKSKNNSWDEYKISNLFNITRGIVIPKNELSETKTSTYKYPVYSSQTSNDGILGYSDIYDFDGKYLTWTTDGANAGKVFYRSGKFRCTNVCGVLYENETKYTNELFAELLNYETPKHVSYVGNPKLMNNVMGNIKLNIPDIKIQNKISKFIYTINTKIKYENNKLNKLHELKKGLMQSMFV